MSERRITITHGTVNDICNADKRNADADLQLIASHVRPAGRGVAFRTEHGDILLVAEYAWHTDTYYTDWSYFND